MLHNIIFLLFLFTFRSILWDPLSSASLSQSPSPSPSPPSPSYLHTYKINNFIWLANAGWCHAMAMAATLSWDPGPSARGSPELLLLLSRGHNARHQLYSYSFYDGGANNNSRGKENNAKNSANKMVAAKHMNGANNSSAQEVLG